jgi:hypothetical protein
MLVALLGAPLALVASVEELVLAAVNDGEPVDSSFVDTDEV